MKIGGISVLPLSLACSLGLGDVVDTPLISIVTAPASSAYPYDNDDEKAWDGGTKVEITCGSSLDHCGVAPVWHDRGEALFRGA